MQAEADNTSTNRWRSCVLGLAHLVIGLALSSAAMAQSTETGDWYLDFGFGANYGEQAELDGYDTKVEYDLGLPRYSGAVARRLGENWWLELELSQRKTKAEYFAPTDGGPSTDPGANDRYTTGGLMLSAIREFHAGNWLVPYVGAGVGPAWITYRLSATTPGSTDEELLITDDTTAAAVQGMLGFRMPLTRRMDLGVEYEYWRTPSASLKSLAGDKIDLDQTIHSGWVSFYYFPGADRAGGFGARRATGEAPRGFYLSASGGVDWVRDTTAGPITFDAYQPGGIMTLAFGHTLGRRWRLEAEYGYRWNEVQIVDFGFYIGERRVGGEQSTSSLGANVIYNLFPDAPVQPSFGIGAGTASTRYDVDYVDDGSKLVDDKSSAGFVQAIAGFDVELTRQLSFRTAWRIMYIDPHDVDLADGSTIRPDHWIHSMEFGLRYQLAR
jgi:opacity protein-like surface antigen